MSHAQSLCRRLCLPGFLALSIFLVPAMSAPAAAQLTDRQWEWGFSVGSANVDSSSEDFDLDLRVDFRGGYLFTDQFELEAQLIQADAVLDAQIRALMLNAVFNFRPDQSIVPYVLVGAGYSELDDINLFGSAPDLEEESGAYQVGVGSRFFLGQQRRMALRLELSSLWIDTDLFDGDRHTSLTAGLSWTVGTR